MPPARQLVRPRYPRMIAGVCSAFALQYGWDLSLVRIITVVFALVTSGFGGLCYLAAWVIIPEGAYALPPNASQSAAYPAAAAPANSSRDNSAV
nr:PspC domain-containing protein [Granulicella aggregans]